MRVARPLYENESDMTMQNENRPTMEMSAARPLYENESDTSAVWEWEQPDRTGRADNLTNYN